MGVSRERCADRTAGGCRWLPVDDLPTRGTTGGERPASEAVPERGRGAKATLEGRSRLACAVPNGLSLARVALGLCFPWLPGGWRAGAVLLAALTDFADGASARLLRCASTTGRYLDPIADKVFLVAVVVTALAEGLLTPLEVVLVGLRDLAVLTVAGWLLFRQGISGWRRARATLLGKTTTAAQFVFFLTLLAGGEPAAILLGATVVISGLAAADYLRRFLVPPRAAG